MEDLYGEVHKADKRLPFTQVAERAGAIIRRVVELPARASDAATQLAQGLGVEDPRV